MDQCFEEIGYPDWYKGKKAKKSTRIADHVNSGFDEHFHSYTPFDMGSENEVGFGQNGGVSEVGTSHAGIICLFTASFALFCYPNMNIKQDWVNDTGASDHMSPNLKLFISTKTLKQPIIVHLPDGSFKTVTIVGEVQLTPHLILKDVFYVPEFQLNFLQLEN
ncbi:hypothetical protein Tco_0308155 [Tanacetum coccineum]